MTADFETSTDFTLSLNQEERAHLLNWLQEKLRTTRVEAHRTDSPDFRKHIIHQEEILELLIEKLCSC